MQSTRITGISHGANVTIRDIGVKYRKKNYSESYPLRCLSDANGDYIAGQVADIISDTQKFDAILDTFFAQLQPVLDAGFTSLANSLKKPVEELTEEEIHTVVDAAAQMYMESMMQALALAQQVPEIAGVARKHASHTDFNKSVADNHDKIDFDRKWNHTRTKLGAPLSLDELAISDPPLLRKVIICLKQMMRNMTGWKINFLIR